MWLNCRLKKCPENGVLKEIKELKEKSFMFRELSRALGTSPPN
jgi:hypothetical protein